MEIIETGIPDLVILKPRIFEDPRGYFFESFNKDSYQKAGVPSNFVQDNQAKSSYGVVRGLHYQHDPHCQAKLVRVLSGAVYDVAVDLRKGSPTYGKHYGIELTGENNLMFYVPRGFAHGYSVISDEAVFFYKCDNLYAPSHEGGLNPYDPELNIDWKIPQNKAVLSEKDRIAPMLKDADIRFTY